MLSQIERNLANPTVAVLWRLANALGVSLTDFLAQGSGAAPAPAVTVVQAHAVPALKSPDGRCELRILGPIDLAGKFEWYELTIQPGGELASEPHEAGTQEHLSVRRGRKEAEAWRNGALRRRCGPCHRQSGQERGDGAAGGGASQLSERRSQPFNPLPSSVRWPAGCAWSRGCAPPAISPRLPHPAPCTPPECDSGRPAARPCRWPATSARAYSGPY
jgi:transcriptional regulator with XRE-family HTH domain